jgi:glycosyltransferase involved in cell wall biosynthesis
MTLDLSIVIPTRDRSASLRTAVESLIAQDFNPDRFEILIVDNGSTAQDQAAAAALARAEHPVVRVLSENAPGASNARNAGWRAARAPIVVFVDDDCVAARDFLASAARAMSSGVEAAGGRVLVRLPFERPAWLTDALFLYLSHVDWPEDPAPLPATRWLASCNLAVRRDVLARHGGFRPDLGPVGGRWRVEEDVELIRQIRLAGGQCWYDPRMIVHHLITPDRVRRRWFLHRCYWGGFSLARASFDANSAAGISVARTAGEALRRRSGMELMCLAMKAAGYATGRLAGAGRVK